MVTTQTSDNDYDHDNRFADNDAYIQWLKRY